MRLTGTEAQQRNAVRDGCIHHLSSLCDPSGEAWEGAETTACDAWPLRPDLGLLHHSIHLQKTGWQWDTCLTCPEVNSQEFLPSAQTEQMTSFPSFTLLPRQCHNLFRRSQRGLHARSVCSPRLCCHTLTLPATNTFLQATTTSECACSLCITHSTSRNVDPALCCHLHLDLPHESLPVSLQDAFLLTHTIREGGVWSFISQLGSLRQGHADRDTK